MEKILRLIKIIKKAFGFEKVRKVSNNFKKQN